MPDMVVTNDSRSQRSKKTADMLQIFKVQTHLVIDSKLLCEVVRQVTETLVAVKYNFSPRMCITQHQIRGHELEKTLSPRW